ncbi:hypothetical protein CCR75_006505 [Bremia lactucae]|uniref:Reverse transcriptase domain-containing protein n=1 Tax=Bremia lactucae TaxID=4779 RepID=A0A976IBI2_BRELC|nr:hypothetical protein CCR75_006505 [Bremia lactucae]
MRGLRVRHLDRTAVPAQVAPTVGVHSHDIGEPYSIQVVGGAELIAIEEALINVQVQTGAAQGTSAFILGKGVLASLGIDAGSTIERIAVSPEHDYDADDLDILNCESVSTQRTILSMELADLQRAVNAGDRDDDGLTDELFHLAVFKSVWRSKLGADPPAKVEPLRVQFAEGAVQATSKRLPTCVRRRPCASRLGARNNHSHWSSPALPIRKGPGASDFRVTVGYTRVNSLSAPIASAMPDMRTVAVRVDGRKFYARFDNYKGFWQLAFHSNCQEQFSCVTEDGVYTPTRVPQGATDRAMHYHNQMHTVYASMLYDSLLIWIDDIIGFVATRKQFVDRMDQFFDLTMRHGLKNSVTKSQLLCREVLWCGKLLGEYGVRHDPERLAALSSLPAPANVADLQRLLCAAYWPSPRNTNQYDLISSLMPFRAGPILSRLRKSTDTIAQSAVRMSPLLQQSTVSTLQRLAQASLLSP